MESKVVSAKISDVNGNGNSKVFIQNDGGCLNMPGRFILANRPRCNKSSKMKEFVTGNPNVGKDSAGFSSVIVLSSIIAIAGAVVAFIMLKY